MGFTLHIDNAIVLYGSRTNVLQISIVHIDYTKEGSVAITFIVQVLIRSQCYTFCNIDSAIVVTANLGISVHIDGSPSVVGNILDDCFFFNSNSWVADYTSIFNFGQFTFLNRNHTRVSQFAGHIVDNKLAAIIIVVHVAINRLNRCIVAILQVAIDGLDREIACILHIAGYSSDVDNTAFSIGNIARDRNIARQVAVVDNIAVNQILFEFLSTLIDDGRLNSSLSGRQLVDSISRNASRNYNCAVNLHLDSLSAFSSQQVVYLLCHFNLVTQSLDDNQILASIFGFQIQNPSQIFRICNREVFQAQVLQGFCIKVSREYLLYTGFQYSLNRAVLRIKSRPVSSLQARKAYYTSGFFWVLLFHQSIDVKIMIFTGRHYGTCFEEFTSGNDIIVTKLNSVFINAFCPIYLNVIIRRNLCEEAILYQRCMWEQSCSFFIIIQFSISISHIDILKVFTQRSQHHRVRKQCGRACRTLLMRTDNQLNQS